MPRCIGCLAWPICASLSCQRDFALAQGFSPEIQLTRTQTLMEGALFCDFRFHLREAEACGTVESEPKPGEPAPK